jgi:hypothetical protein
MKAHALLLAAGLALGAAAPALAKGTAPDPAQFPAGPAYAGKTAPVDLKSEKSARTFKTRLAEASKGKPNFAGHVIVAMWGCGTSCQTIALIDARTGKVSFGPTATAGARYDVKSRLLVVNPPKDLAELPKEMRAATRTEYYLWDKGALRKIG